MRRRTFALLFAGPAIVLGCDLEFSAESEKKIEICHIPPGNHCAAHTIEISKSALEMHLAHGDHVGVCIGTEGLDDEICDGIDNDCDGTTDEDCSECMDYPTCTKKPAGPEPCPPPPGEVCNGKDDDCDGAIDEGCNQCTNYETCVPLPSPNPCPPAPEEICDKQDNDCDGTIDEGCPECGGTGLLAEPCECTDYSDCSSYPSQDPCPKPPPEVCDGKDNDCDGVIDPGCHTCTDFNTCNQVSTSEPCPPPPAEICDGKDNDCDGSVDESCNVCTNFTTCTTYPSSGTCPPPPAEICDGKDNDCDGLVDESDPQLGLACNVGQVCKAGIWVCKSGSLSCAATPTPNDLDADGIGDDADLDDDGDGVPDASDEFPKALTVLDRVIDFDLTPTGAQLGHGEILGEQYAAKGVHFASQYHIARRLIAFPCYNGTSTLNVLCTPVGASGGMCTGPGSTELVVNLDMQVDYASLEFRTRCDGPYDGDMGTLLGVTATSSIPDTVVVNNGAAFPNEGMVKAVVQAPGIQQLRVNPGDFDSLDTLRIVRLKPPCQ